jgi:hypothetical protein
MRVLIGLLLMMGLGLAVAQDQTRPTLAEAKAEFQKQDQALNKIYATRKEEFLGYQLPVVQEGQRGWMECRDYVSEGQARPDPEKFMLADEGAEGRAYEAGESGRHVRMRLFRAVKEGRFE